MEIQQNTKPTSAILLRLRTLFAELQPEVAIPQALYSLSLAFPARIVLDEPTIAIYTESLQMLEPEQLALAFSLAQLQSEEYFPTPGELRQLAGVETSHQRSEREAREVLSWLFWMLRRHGLDGHAARGVLIKPAGRDENGTPYPAEYEWIPAPKPPERTLRALDELGAGNGKVGAELIAQHPMMSRNPDEYPSLGLKLAAAEKLEQRWIEAWRKTEDSVIPTSQQRRNL